MEFLSNLFLLSPPTPPIFSHSPTLSIFSRFFVFPYLNFKRVVVIFLVVNLGRDVILGIGFLQDANRLIRQSDRYSQFGEMLVNFFRALQCYRLGNLVDAYQAFEKFSKYLLSLQSICVDLCSICI